MSKALYGAQCVIIKLDFVVSCLLSIAERLAVITLQ